VRLVPLLVCVSDLVYRQVIAQRHEGLDPTTFEAAWFESGNVREVDGCVLLARQA